MPFKAPFLWLRSYPYFLLAAIFFCVVAVPFLRKTDSQFDNVYLRAAQRLQAAEDFYPLKDGYLYPPLMAWLSIPLTYIPPAVARVIWLGINLGCLSLLWIWSWRLAGGVRLNSSTDWREHLICWLGLACAFRYGLDCLQNQQTDLVIAALVVGGCVALRPSQEAGARLGVVIAATCFGVAAGMKCTALLWAPYLLWRGRWLAALWVAVVAIGLNLLPNLTSTPEHGGLWLGEWVHRYLSVLTRADHSPGIWGSAVTLNQSWSGALYRWFATTWTWDAAGFAVAGRADAFSPQALKIVVYGSELVMLGVAAWVMGLAKSPRKSSGLNVTSLEYSLVILLMVLLSPMSSKPHFCILLLPAWVVARCAIENRSWLLGAFLALSIATGALAIKDLATANLASVAMWYGGVTWGALFLLFGCTVARWQHRRLAITLAKVEQPRMAESRSRAA